MLSPHRHFYSEIELTSPTIRLRILKRTLNTQFAAFYTAHITHDPLEDTETRPVLAVVVKDK